jgi:hypothetical protein
MSLRIKNKASRQNTLAGFVRAKANTDAQKTVLSRVFEPQTGPVIELSAESVASSTTSANLNTQISLNSTATAANSTSASVTTAINLNAASVNLSTSSASVTTAIRLAAISTSESATTAPLTVQGGLDFAATSSAISSTSATLTTNISLAATSVAQSDIISPDIQTGIILGIREASGDTGLVEPFELELGSVGIAFSTPIENAYTENGLTADVTINNGNRSRYLKFPLKHLGIPNGAIITGLELSVLWGSTNSTSTNSFLTTTIIDAAPGSNVTTGTAFNFGSTTSGVYQEQTTGLLAPNTVGKYNYPGALTAEDAATKAIAVYIQNMSGISFRLYKIDSVKVRATYESQGQLSTAEMITAITLEAESTVVTNTTGELIAPSQHSLEATSVTASSTTANISTGIALQSNCLSLNTASAAIQTQILFSQTAANSQSQTSANLTTQVRLAAQSSAVAVSGAVMVSEIRLSATSGAVTLAVAPIDTKILLNAQEPGLGQTKHSTIASLNTRQSINFANGVVTFADNTNYPIVFQEYNSILVNGNDYGTIVVHERL